MGDRGAGRGAVAVAALIKKKVSALKKLLWKEFSLWVKLNYSTDGQYCPCFTCGKSLEIGTSNCQAGHWLAKSVSSYHRFRENNVRPQCYKCNINLSGNAAVFERNLKDEIGADAVEDMYNTRHENGRRSRDWYVEKIEYYREQLKDMNG